MNANQGSSKVDLILNAGIVAKVVLAILLLSSIASWAIILYKWIALRRTESENRRFLILFSKTDDLADMRRIAFKSKQGQMALLLQSAFEKIDSYIETKGVLPGALEDGNRQPSIASLERIINSGIRDEMDYQGHYLHFLATIGNVAPFIGLFGTVWGILDAFQEIGRQGQANIAAVGPGIAEALITTAASLVTAIPAAIAYNIFVNRLRKMEVQLEVFATEFIGLIEEKVLKPQHERKVK